MKFHGLSVRIKLYRIQHAPVESIETEIVPQAVEMIETLKTAWREGNHRKVVELIGQEVRQSDDSEGEEFQRVVEAALLADGSGEITRHPYIHTQLSRLMARWAYKLMTGGGIELPAFALADDGYLVLQNGKVLSRADWMPLSAAITTVPSQPRPMRALPGTHERRPAPARTSCKGRS